MHQTSAMSFDWFVDVLTLSNATRTKLEDAGITFVAETEPPFSREGGPVSSIGVRLDSGSEFWLVADELYADGEFTSPPASSEHHWISVRVAPEQFDMPADAAAEFRLAFGIEDAEVAWSLDVWGQIEADELAKRRGG